MKYGVLGTGMVGDAIASKLVALGNEVMIGSRDAKNPRAAAWAQRTGGNVGTFAEAARFGELLFNCTHGAKSVEALFEAGVGNVGDKILVDVANVLSPDVLQNESLGEQIQRTFPNLKVVKSLNTVNCDVMVEPSVVDGAHTLFVCGDDAAAKKTVEELVRSFGWQDIIDLGDIANARATEGYLPLWVVLWKNLGTAHFNISVVR